MRRLLSLAAVSWAVAVAGCSSGGSSNSSSSGSSGSVAVGSSTLSGAVKLDGAAAPAGTVVLIAGPTPSAVQTDANGQYSATKLLDGSYAVIAQLPSTTEGQQLAQVAVPKAGAATAPDLAFHGLGSISGTVALSSGANPAGIPVSADGASATLTDTQGHFSITRVPVGAHTVTASLPNSATASATVTVAYNQDAAAGTLTLTGQVTSNGSISGTVQIAGETDLSGVELALVGPSSATMTTSASGVFTFSNLRDGHYVITASGTSLAPTSITQGADVTSGTGPQSLVLAFTPVGSISGTITLAGAPLAGASVLLQGSTLAATTAADGTYQLDGVAAGTRALTIAASGAVPGTASATVTRGQTATASVDLQPVTGPSTLTGQALLPDGTPAVNAQVHFGGASAAADPSGIYTLAGLDPQLGTVDLNGADPVYRESIPMVLAIPGSDGQYLGNGSVESLAPIELARGARALQATCANVTQISSSGTELLVYASNIPTCAYNYSLARTASAAPASGWASYRVLADGGTYPVGDASGNTQAVNYTPDGSQVLYVQYGALNSSLYLSDATGAARLVSSALPPSTASYASSPDSQKVAFWTDPASVNDTLHRHLVLADLATNVSATISQDAIQGDVFFVGGRIAWIVWNATNSNYELWVGNYDGTNAHLVSATGSNTSYVFDPEGLVVFFNDGTGLKGTTLDNPNVQALTVATTCQFGPPGTLLVYRDDTSPAEVDVWNVAVTNGSLTLHNGGPALVLPPNYGTVGYVSATLNPSQNLELLEVTNAGGGTARTVVGPNGTFASLTPQTPYATWPVSAQRMFVQMTPDGSTGGWDFTFESFDAQLAETDRSVQAQGPRAYDGKGNVVYALFDGGIDFDSPAGTPIPLPSDTSIETPGFSSDGHHLTYTSGGHYFVLTPPATAGVDLGTYDANYGVYGFYSQDSQKLAYVLNLSSSTSLDAHIVNADGTGALDVGAGCPVDFSPDHSTLALYNGFDPNSSLARANLVDAATGTVTPVLDGLNYYSIEGCSHLGLSWVMGSTLFEQRNVAQLPYNFQVGAYVLPKP